jgi:peptidoglycan/LPS O-acetylase OafA/YrhL
MRRFSRFSAGPAVAAPYAASSRRRSWGELEGWRIIAALGIVALHVWQHAWQRNPATAFHPPAYALFPYLQSLDLFVDFFFVVSGLVLAYPYLKALIEDPDGAGVDRFRGFMVQRYLRVAPVYYAILVFVWSIRNFGARTADWMDLIEHLTFTQWLDPHRIFFSIGPAWSVAVEFWMYPLIPLLFFGARGLARRRSTRWGRAVVGAVIPVLILVVGTTFMTVGKLVWKVPLTNHAYWYSLPAKLDDFALGILLALVVAAAGGRRFGLRWAWTFRIAGAASLALIVAHRYQGSPARYFTIFDNFEVMAHPLATAAFAVLVLPSLLGRRRDAVNHVIGARPFVVAGGFTYALYLVHEPLLRPLTAMGILGGGAGDMLRNWLTILPISFALAIGFYMLIEWPFLRIRTSFDRRTGRSRDYYPHLRGLEVGREGPRVGVSLLPASVE